MLFRRQRTPLVVTALVAGAGTFYYLKMKAVRERSEQAKREGSKDNFYVTPGRSGRVPLHSLLLLCQRHADGVFAGGGI